MINKTFDPTFMIGHTQIVIAYSVRCLNVEYVFVKSFSLGIFVLCPTW